MRENLSFGFANNEGEDQPANPRSLIDTFVLRFLKSIISKFATNEISIFLLVSVAEETDLSFPLLETRRQVLSRRGPSTNQEFESIF